MVIHDSLDKKYYFMNYLEFNIFTNYLFINTVINVSQGILYILTKCREGTDLLNINW